MMTHDTRSTTRHCLGALTVALPLAIGILAMPSTVDGQDPPPGREEPSYTPFTVAPRLLNMDEVRQALMREYPSELREEGIGGTVTLWFFIDVEGQVANAIVDQSSGHPALDEAALAVARIYRFSPAMNRDERVPVWVSLPITFAVREPPPGNG